MRHMASHGKKTANKKNASYGLVLGLALSALSSTSHALDLGMIGYLVEQGFRQGALLLQAKPIDSVLKDPQTPQDLRWKLQLATELRHYAKDHLGMNTGRAYRSYLALNRPWISMVVTAAHRDRLEEVLFEYPLFGAMPYKGFFEEEDALRFERQLQAQGLDTYLRPVDAFSSTGWLPDPITSAMIKKPERLVELVFHELTHTTFYFENQADFNEAFASWMGVHSAKEFLLKSEYPQKNEWVKSIENAKNRQLLLARHVQELVRLGKTAYAASSPENSLENIRNVFLQQVQQSWTTLDGFSSWSKEQWNHAKLLSLSTYFNLYEPIDAYAKKNGLSPKQYLQLVKDKGPAVIPEILKQKTN